MDTLRDALLYPLSYDDFNAEDENIKLNPITGFRVVKEYTDDGVSCYDLEVIVNEKLYKFSDLWAGRRCARMYYQSEISQEIRDNVLNPYILSKLREGEI